MAKKTEQDEEVLDEELSESEEPEELEETDESKENEEESLEETIESLKKEVDTWKTDYYKVFADMENVKRRLQKEHQDSLKFMLQNFIESLLPIIDNFERSLAVENPSDEVAGFLKGYEMIFNQLMTVLKDNGVEPIEALGKEFDPNLHQAVMTGHDEAYGENEVIEELQKGYKLKDRVIRASLVKVNK